MAAFQDADAAPSMRPSSSQRDRSPPGRGRSRVELRMGAAHAATRRPRGGDYHAPAVNRADRVRRRRPRGPSAPLGEHCHVGGADRDQSTWASSDLKGLPRQHLHQVLAEGLPAEFPPLVSSARAASAAAVPSPSTSFIGRQADLAARRRACSRSPPPGHAHRRGQDRERPAWRSPSPNMSATGTRAASRLPTSPRPPTTTRVGDHGRDRPRHPRRRPDRARRAPTSRSSTILCILDNCEHVLDAGRGRRRRRPRPRRSVAAAGDEPGAARRRRRAGVRGRRHSPVDTEAVELFEARAREAGAPDRAPTTASSSRGRRALPPPRRDPARPRARRRPRHPPLPAQLVERLDDRFRLLTGGPPARLPPPDPRRHARLEPRPAASPTSRRCSGASRSSPAASRSPPPSSWPASTTPSTCSAPSSPSRSCSGCPQTDGTLRYRLLETVRLYAAERLAIGRGGRRPARRPPRHRPRVAGGHPPRGALAGRS